MTWEDVVAIGAGYPGCAVSTSYGTPALKVRGKLMTRLRPEDDSLVLLEVALEEKAMLIAADPALFHTTAHYDGYPAILARLAALQPAQLRQFLDRRYRAVAGARLLSSWGQRG